MANQNNAQQAKKSQSGNDSWQNWGSWQNPQNWEAWSETVKNPGKFFDYGKLRQTATKTAETATAANQVALESMQAIARRAAENGQEHTKQSWECFKDACASKSPEEAQWKQSNFLNYWVQNYCGTLREVTEIAAKATVEIVDLWNKRATDSVSEWSNK